MKDFTMMKKIMVTVLAMMTLVLSLAGCGEAAKQNADNADLTSGIQSAENTGDASAAYGEDYGGRPGTGETTVTVPENQVVTINLNKYMTADPRLYGTNGQGKVQQSYDTWLFTADVEGFDEALFMADMTELLGSAKAAMLKTDYKKVWRGVWTPEKELSNGDTIVLQWTGDLEYLKDSWGIVFEGEEIAYTVTGLPD